jgi:hypothetical protein
MSCEYFAISGREQFVFGVEVQCVFCEITSGLLCVIKINLRLQELTKNSRKPVL